MAPGAGRKKRDPSRAKTRAGDPPRKRAWSAALTKVVIAATLVLMVGYTAYAVVQIEEMSKPSDSAGIDNRAELLAARVSGDVAALRAALTSAGAQAARSPDSPMEAAETGLAAASKAARAVAVVGPSGVLAQTSQLRGADWAGAVRLADAAADDLWIGPVDNRSGIVYAVHRTAGAKPVSVVAALDLNRLLPEQPIDDLAIIATRDGKILTLGGATKAIGGRESLRDALGVDPGGEALDGIGSGKVPGGAAMQVAQARAVDGGLIAVVASPETASMAARTAMARDRVYSLLAPLVIGLGLALLLTIQSRRAEEARRAQADTEQRFRLAVEAARCGIWEWDLKADQVVMSDVTGVMLGWGGSGVSSGDDVIARIAPEHRERVRAALDAARTYGAFDVSFRSPRPDGRSVWIDARGQAITGRRTGEGARIVGVALDVTDERFAQARAQAAESRLRDAIDSVSEAFVLWDRMGRLLMCNRNYRAFFNLEPRVLKPGVPRESVERFARLAIEREEPTAEGETGVREALLNDGRWVQISERRTADGGLVMTAADITAIKTQDEARRKNEEALQLVVSNLEASQAELAELAKKYEAAKIKAESANTAKSEFLANMSHELRTPLNAINGFSEIMVGEMFGPLGDARYKEYSGDILSSGQHLLALINDILDMSKIEAGKMQLRFEPIQFHEVVDDTVRLMRNRADQADLTLEVDLPEMLDIDADYRAIKQVLLNLLSNSIKFTPKGGKVTVSGAVLTNATSERLKISVTDTGIGIAPDDLQRLAQPFEQIESQHSKTQQGTGLGLALSKSLIEMHGGVLEMESEPGVGTTVSFTIPFRQSQERRAGSFAA